MSAGLMLEGLQCFESGQQLGDTIWTFTLPAPRGASLRTQPLGRHSLTEGTYAAVLSVVHGRQSSPAEMVSLFVSSLSFQVYQIKPEPDLGKEAFLQVPGGLGFS